MVAGEVAIPRTYEAAHVRAIHRHLFQDVYEWAGEYGESSRIKDRPQWLACLDHLRPGDTLVVRRLARIAGSEKVAIETINELHESSVNTRV